MNLLLILLSIVVFALISHFFKQYYKFFVLISILLVVFCYFFIIKEKVDIGVASSWRYKNLSLNGMLNVFKEKRLYFVDIRDCPKYKLQGTNSESDIATYIINNLEFNEDFSLYNYKTYSYFGITPILLFYLPFNLITGLYLLDGTVVFFLLVSIFLLSLFLFKRLLMELDIKNRNYSIEILSIFLIGIGSYFLHQNCDIYNIEIETSIFLTLLAICIFYLYLKEKSITKQQVFVFLISLSLALSVGARPQNLLLIPFFLLGIIYGNCYRDKNHILKIIIIFLVPCILYGSLLAVYNYLRFDSIFDFGYFHLIANIIDLDISFNNFLISVKNSFFCIPDSDMDIIFSLHWVDEQSARCNQGLMCGFIWSCPVTLFLLITPYIYKIFKNKTNFILFLNICFITIFIEFICTNMVATWTRYVDEYLIIMLILSLSFFMFIYNKNKNKVIKVMLMLTLIIIFVCSMFINISFIFCDREGLVLFVDRYNIIKFLFSL